MSAQFDSVDHALLLQRIPNRFGLRAKLTPVYKKVACVVGAKRKGGGGRGEGEGEKPEGEKPGEREKPSTPYPLPLSTPATQANKKDDPKEIGNYRLNSYLLSQTRTQSLFNICFGGERRLGVRLRRAGSHGKGPLSTSARKRLNLFRNLLSPPKHIYTYTHTHISWWLEKGKSTSYF